MFIIIAIGWGLLIPLLLLAPLRPVVASAWNKRPRVAWRAAVILSFAAAALPTLPISPLFVGFYSPLSFAGDPAATAFSFVGAVLLPFINLSLVVEIALAPLIAATLIHSLATRTSKPKHD